MSEFIIAQSEVDYREAAALLREYEAGLGIDPVLSVFSRRTGKPRAYVRPAGRAISPAPLRRRHRRMRRSQGFGRESLRDEAPLRAP